jgi:hypothetical protein
MNITEHEYMNMSPLPPNYRAYYGMHCHHVFYISCNILGPFVKLNFYFVHLEFKMLLVIMRDLPTLINSHPLLVNQLSDNNSKVRQCMCVTVDWNDTIKQHNWARRR